MNDSTDCIVCGTCVADILVRPVPLDTAVGGGRLFHVDPITATVGGIVCNTGTAIRRLGASVAAAAFVGEDVWGNLIRERLTSERIDIAGIEADHDGATSTTAVLIDAGGERSFAHHIGAAGLLDAAFIRRHLARFARSRIAVIGYVGLLPALEPTLAEIVAEIRATGCRVAVETGGSGGSLVDVSAALPHVDLFVPSLDEARRKTGLADPREIIDCYRSHGAAGILGVKCGPDGSVLSPSPGVIVEVPCVPAPGPVVDTTGAGDAFLAGLVVGLLHDMPVARAGLLAAATAACCVTAAGATAGLRSLDEALRLAGIAG
ncbi:MAG: carbohydrate kinase family protein [Pirellulales bacterium]